MIIDLFIYHNYFILLYYISYISLFNRALFRHFFG
nr:MAG TPA_asm: hypothetical protein [Caudoviricetes sp.]